LKDPKRAAEGNIPFASITWIRFKGSAALPHYTLSLYA